MKPPRRAIYSYVCGGLHSLDHAALTSFEHERAHYGARLSPFVPVLSVDNQRRTERVSTLVATEYDRTERISTLWSRPSTRSAVYRAHLHFGRSRVRGARAGRRWRWRGAWRGRAWPKLSMARSHAAAGASAHQESSTAAAQRHSRAGLDAYGPDTLWRRFYTPPLHPAVPRGGQHRTRKMGRATHSERF
jgi:hypothetical protein